jgi:hypothetical protein
MSLSIAEYRGRVEEMTAEALEEYYEHGAGLKPTLELTPIYDRYADLATLEEIAALRAAAAPVELLRFASETYIGNGTKQLSDQVANTESALVITRGEEQIGYRAMRPRILNEPDPDVRRDLHRLRCEATERDLNPLLAEAAERDRELVDQLGAGSMLELYEGLGYDPVGLGRQAEAFLDETEELYRRELGKALRDRVGVELERAGPQDVARLWRAPEFDRGFPASEALPALRATLAGMGIDLNSQRNVIVDMDARAGKHPRAFCAPVRVPQRVILVVLPQGGQDDYHALFHEAGHAEHFAHTAADLPAEARLLGDNGVTEGFAFLLEHLIANPAWLAARLSFPRPDEYLRFIALSKLCYLRRYCAKLLYEIELHRGARLSDLPDRYAELLTLGVGVPYPASDYLEDVDGGFYCTCYLRAWAFEAQLTGYLKRRYGVAWFADRKAGSLVRELWNLGQSLRADELLDEVCGEQIDLAVLAEEAKEALR